MPSELDHTSQEPLYLQVIEDIRRDIASGLYRAGEKIPSELELGDIYRVSRITVRNAVKVLEKEGLLVKRQGKGTFVTAEAEHKAPFENDDIVRSFTKTCENNGVVPGARLVACERALLPFDRPGFFGGADNGAAIRVIRVRTADDVPLMVEDNLFDPVKYRFLLDENLEDRSIFEVIERKTGLVPRNSTDCILSMERATPQLAELLDVAENEPLFTVSGEYSDQYGDPMFLGLQHVVGKHYSFRL